MHIRIPPRHDPAPSEITPQRIWTRRRELVAAAVAAGLAPAAFAQTGKPDMKLDAKPGVTLVVPDLSIAFLDGEERVRSAIAACISAAGARSSA